MQDERATRALDELDRAAELHGAGRGGRDVAPDVVRARLAARRERFDADAAFPIDDDLLDRYPAGFERPHGEGETVIGVRG